MEIVLYGDSGYYSTPRDISRDYATSPHVHPAFGALIARHLATMWQALEEPTTFTLIELGAGDGSLMLDIRGAVDAAASKSDLLRRFKAALRYLPLDIAPRNENVSPDNGTAIVDPGCVLSNELLDAFPAHRFIIKDRRILELYVTLDTRGNLIYVEDRLSTPSIEERIGQLVEILPDGYCGEVNLNIGRWADNVADMLRRGYVLTIDYGHPREILYHPNRAEGSLRCYRNHVLSQNPFREVGEQDITTHVDFTAVNDELSARGFNSAAPSSTQREFLRQIGINCYTYKARRELAAAITQPEASEGRADIAALNALIDPRGLGSFQVAQHRIHAPPLPMHQRRNNIEIPLPKPKDRHLTYA